jgi:hypothetical protein
MTDIYIATEDALSEAVVDRLIEDENHGITISIRLRRNGKGYLHQLFPSLVRLAHKIPVILLVDLDRIECPATLISSWNKSGDIPDKMLFRIAVREVESWLLADRSGFADFARAPLSKIPAKPESLFDPKDTLINIIRRYGSRDVQADILPKARSTAKEGMRYNERLACFVRDFWSPDRAAQVSDSLHRMRVYIHNLRIREGKIDI